MSNEIENSIKETKFSLLTRDLIIDIICKVSSASLKDFLNLKLRYVYIIIQFRVFL